VKKESERTANVLSRLQAKQARQTATIPATTIDGTLAIAELTSIGLWITSGISLGISLGVSVDDWGVIPKRLA